MPDLGTIPSVAPCRCLDRLSDPAGLQHGGNVPDRVGRLVASDTPLPVELHGQTTRFPMRLSNVFRRCRRSTLVFNLMTRQTEFSLKGEVALVTGGTRNIGLSIAKAFRDAGARVCIWGGSDSEALRHALASLDGDETSRIGLRVRVEDEDAVIGSFDQIESQLGPVSILINNAADRPYEPLKTMSRNAWNAVVDVVLTGAFLTSRELFRRLPADRNGAIVNIGGLSAHRPGKNRAHVISAKAGLIGLTRALAEEGLGQIRCNAVVPGAIRTEVREGSHGPRFMDDSQHAIGRPDDVARAVLSLADPSEQYVTGQTLHVSGGRYMP